MSQIRAANDAEAIAGSVRHAALLPITSDSTAQNNPDKTATTRRQANAIAAMSGGAE